MEESTACVGVGAGQAGDEWAAMGGVWGERRKLGGAQGLIWATNGEDFQMEENTRAEEICRALEVIKSPMLEF